MLNRLDGGRAQRQAYLHCLGYAEEREQFGRPIVGGELMGGNGILIEHNVARFVADAEAIYSSEGTREMQSLIVGRGRDGPQRFRLITEQQAVVCRWAQ